MTTHCAYISIQPARKLRASQSGSAPEVPERKFECSDSATHTVLVNNDYKSIRVVAIKNATTKPAKKVADGWYCALHADVIASQKWEATIRPGRVQARAAFSISDTNPEGWLSVRMRVFNETGNAQHVHVVDIRQKDFASEWLATVQATSIRSEGQTF